MQRRRITIVGGGAGGLELASLLGRARGKGADIEVTLVDSRTSHFWKPLLHQVASGALDSHLDEVNFLGQGARSGFRYEFGSLSGLDKAQREIILAPVADPDTGEELLATRRVGYDDLVLAVGARSNDFGIPGVREHAHSLDSREEAQVLRRRLLAYLAQRYVYQAEGSVRVVIVGGGATGVELAAELVEMGKVLKAHAETAEGKLLTVTVLETAPRILAGVSEDVAEETHRALEDLGVSIITSSKVVEVRPREVLVEGSEPVPADITVWAAGVRGQEVLGRLGLPVAKNGRLIVDAKLICQGEERIHALGDCSLCEKDGRGNPVPARAQAASQQARYLAERLGKPPEQRRDDAFVYKDRGTLVSLASFTAFGKIGNRPSNFVSGRLAQLAYSSLRRSHQATLLGLPRTGTIILSDWLRNSVRPPLKLDV